MKTIYSRFYWQVGFKTQLYDLLLSQAHKEVRLGVFASPQIIDYLQPNQYRGWVIWSEMV